ncbi:Peptidoglycan/LPS O-acetylase OafA/YrhL, contains acyltransferase and SGNH-hydrolase domains [Pedobacter sp. ok626]|uniref:acyltransferase family protein n=1 Tax=Pedobacter sp. ok626 TaxID=1761882 RepID=UPI000889E73B|nr:acyltransferase [Pedobacter sp. ok626]SDJ56292.1 Peptidoglycan/LPS O-acetylase OafA/YrhL, contains acyltransferase and SGNH-hydrolase domains [Pedobacter sp. ok626]
MKNDKLSQRSGALDLLRFLAVLIVFFSHYTDTFNYVYKIVPENLKYLPIFKYGSLALVAFFIVSGYVITMTSMKKSIKDFIVIRLSRIYPLFWVSCTVAFILPRAVNEHTFIAFSSFNTYLINMTMVPGLLGTPLINPVYHTLLLELLFYFFIAIIIVFKLWDRMLLIIGVLTVFCIVRGLDATAYSHIVIPPFAGGILFYYLKIKYGNPIYLRILLCLNFISSLMIGRTLERYLNGRVDDVQTINSWIAVTIIAAIYGIFYLIVTDRFKISSNRITVMLGEIAYPFYLFHVYFLIVYWYFRDSIQEDALLLSILALVICSSWLINQLVEKPLNKICSQLLYFLFNLFKRNKNSPEVLTSRTV